MGGGGMALTRILQAADFAARKHRGQQRKGSRATPYINHPIGVARLIAEVGGVEDEDVLVAALLHDTIEDTGTTAEELEQVFGTRVRALVVEMTDDKSLPKAERKRLQIEHAPDKSPEATLIKLADKISNVAEIAEHPPEGWSLERRRDYLDWAEQVVMALPPANAALRARFDEALAAARVRIAKQSDR